MKTGQIPEHVNSGTYCSDRNVPFHRHPGVELVFVCRGECSVSVNGLELYGKQNDLFILPADTDHNQVNYGTVETSYAAFKSIESFDETPRVLELEHDSWIGKWLKEISELRDRLPTQFDNLASGLLYSMIQRIQQIENIQDSRQAFPLPLRNALRFIETNLNNPLLLNDIADSQGISGSYLSMLFKSYLSTSPISYAIKLKMNYAEQLLGDPYLSVKEISYKCGFQDSNYFCRLFRKYHNCSPGQYRTK